jgi:hypothetical protein
MVMSWPQVLIPRRCDPELRNFVKSGGRTTTGRRQNVFSDAGYWEINATEFPIHTAERATAWRAMMARLRSGEEIDVLVYNVYTPDDGSVALFDAAATLDAAARATLITFSVDYGDIAEGHMFTLAGRYLHTITKVVSRITSVSIPQWFTTGDAWSDATGTWSDDNSAGGEVIAVNILPPLRAPILAGDHMEFQFLSLRCVLDEMRSGDLSLDKGQFGFPSIILRESI